MVRADRHPGNFYLGVECQIESFAKKKCEISTIDVLRTKSRNFSIWFAKHLSGAILYNSEEIHANLSLSRFRK